MIVYPTVTVSETDRNKYWQFGWMNSGRVSSPFVEMAAHMFHYPSHCVSFNERNIFWNGLSSEDVNTLFQWTQHSCANDVFADLVLGRAQELVWDAQEHSLPVYLLWSGGIDSTAMLIACRMLLEEQDVPYTVVCTPLAKDEYPAMFKQLQQQKVHMAIHSHLEFYEQLYAYYQDGIVASGMCGDQLGSGAFALAFQCGAGWDAPRRHHWRKYILRQYPNALDETQRFIDATGMDITDVLELSWAINIAFKWDYVKYAIAFWTAAMQGVGAKIPLDRHFTFYGTDDFRRYGIDYYRACGLSRGREGRPFTKAFILDETGDKEYFRDKLKVATRFNVRPYIGHIEDGFAIIDSVRD